MKWLILVVLLTLCNITYGSEWHSIIAISAATSTIVQPKVEEVVPEIVKPKTPVAVTTQPKSCSSCSTQTNYYRPRLFRR
jgi:hypothetical protein